MAAIKAKATFQPLIFAGERSGLLTRIATTGSGSLCPQTEKLTAFLELETVTRYDDYRNQTAR
jgi:hypothetical protein